MYQLTAITQVSDLKQLQQLYKEDWPKHCVGYYWLDNFLGWLLRQAKHIAFYTVNNDWRSDGLFIVVHRYQLYFTNLSRTKTPELLIALRALNWTNGFKVSAIYEPHYIAFKEFLEERRLSVAQEQKTIMYYMPWEKAKSLELRCPSNYYLAPLRLEHASLINQFWSARHHGSLKLIELLITHNVNIGLYKKNSQELCGWCLRLQSGFLGALVVKPDHQRKGFGILVASAIAKRISNELQHDVTALVYPGNIAASKLFERIGFTLLKGEHYFWTMSLPTAGDHPCWPKND